MNVRNFGALALGITLTTGCSGKEGIWVLQLEAKPISSEDSCDEEATDWNFAGATVPTDVSGPDPWTTEETTTLSNQILLVQFAEKGGQATLLVGDTIYPSVAGKGNTWQFALEASTRTVYEANNAFGYACSEEVLNKTTVTFDLVFDGKLVTGTSTVKDEFTASYEESDRWQEDVSGDEMCSMPAGNYLEVVTGRGPSAGTAPASNARDQIDCSADPCYIDVERRCTDTYTITGYESGMNGETTYGPTDDDGQGFGGL